MSLLNSFPEEISVYSGKTDLERQAVCVPRRSQLNLFVTVFSSATRMALDAVLGFEPRWHLTGRAAHWWRTTDPGQIKHLSLIWHGRPELGALSREIRWLLDEAGLDSGVLYSSPRRLWLGLGIGDPERSGELRLTAEPAPPLERPWQTVLHGHPIYVETLRDNVQTTLGSFLDRPNTEDVEDLYLLWRGGISLEQGLLDLQRRDPGFDPQQLARHLARFKVNEVDLPVPGLRRFELFRRELVLLALRA